MTPSPRKRVLVTAPYFLPVCEEYRPRFVVRNIELVPHEVYERATEAELLPLVSNVDGVICGDDRFTDRVLQSAQKLKVIAKWGTGIDSIDLEACKKRGIIVLNTEDAFSIPVADSVVGYALAFSRNLFDMNREMKSGRWAKIPGRSLFESVFGIIGVGNVGREVAKRISAFGGTLLGNDLRPISPNILNATGMRSVSLDELLSKSDFVSLNCDLNPTSLHLIRHETLSLMQPSSVLINTSRGPIINEADLTTHLLNGKLKGAALDVFEDEPLPPNSQLLKMDNVLLAPHNSNSSPTAWSNVHENTVRMILEALI